MFGDVPGSPRSLLGRLRAATAAITGRAGPGARCDERGDPAYVPGRVHPAAAAAPGDIYLSYVPEDRMWADWITALLAPRGIRILRPREIAGAAAARRGARRPRPPRRDPVSRVPPVAAGPRAGTRCGPPGPGAQAVPDPRPGRRDAARAAVLRAGRSTSTRDEDAGDRRRSWRSATRRRAPALARPGPEPRFPATIPPHHVPSQERRVHRPQRVLEKLHDQLIGG